MLAAFLTTILFSISAVSGGRTARLLGGTEANFWRLCLAAALLAVYAHGFGGGVAGNAFSTFFISGCIGFGIGDMALFQALPRLGSRLSVLLTLCLSSPLAALMEWVWIGTRLTPLEIACAIVILAGVALALAPERPNTTNPTPATPAEREHSTLPGPERPTRPPTGLPTHGRTLAVGLAFGLLASFCQALGAVLSRKAFSIATASAQAIDGITAAYQRILGGVAVAVIVYAIVKHRERSRPSGRSGPPDKWRRAWPWLVLNGVAGPALGVSCYQWALKTTPTGVVLPIVAITPIVIIPLAYFIEHERPTRRSLLGGTLAVGGAVALAWATKR